MTSRASSTRAGSTMPISKLIRAQIRVWLIATRISPFGTVTRSPDVVAERRPPEADGLDLAGRPGDLDPVADPELVLEHDDRATDIVADDVLGHDAPRRRRSPARTRTSVVCPSSTRTARIAKVTITSRSSQSDEVGDRLDPLLGLLDRDRPRLRDRRSLDSSRRMSIRVTNRRLIRRTMYAMTATMRIDERGRGELADGASSCR